METMQAPDIDPKILRGWIDTFKEGHLDLVKEEMHERGIVLPNFTILAMDMAKKEVHIVIVPLADLMYHPEMTTILSELVVPGLFKQLKAQNQYPLCFSYTTEGQARIYKPAPGEPLVLPDNWRELPAHDMLSVSFETLDGGDKDWDEVFYIKRTGAKHLNSEGDLVDTVELEPMITEEERKDPENKPMGGAGKMHGLFQKHFQALKPGRVPTGL